MPQLPVMATVLRSSVRTVLQAVKAWLVAQEVATADRIKLVARPFAEVQHTMGDADLVLRPGRFVPTGNETGAGRYDTRIRRLLEVAVRSRLESDEVDSDQLWLLQDAAHLALEEAVIAALQIFPPEDADSNILLAEPMRLADGAAAERRKDKRGWGQSVLTFEMVYVLPLEELDVSGDVGGGGSGGSGGGSEAETGWFWGWFFG